MSQATGTEVLGLEETSMNVAAILKMKGKGVFTASADTSLLEIAKLLDQHGIGCIVIEGEEGKVAASCPSATWCGRSVSQARRS